MLAGLRLFEAAFTQNSTSSEASTRIQKQMEVLAANDPFWATPQCKSLLITKLLQIGLERETPSVVSMLCQALYLDNFISKQQLRRAITRLCCSFEPLFEPEIPRSARLLAAQMVELAEMGLILPKILTILPLELIRMQLAPASAPFRQTFQKELALLAQGRSVYLTRVDALLDPCLALFRHSSAQDADLKDFDAGRQAMSQRVRSFLSQEVVLEKWAALNWVFVRRSIELALADPHVAAGPFLSELFDEVTKPGNGFAAMDFGYAFDNVIWGAEHLPEQSEVAAIIAAAIRSDIVPLKYLTDAEPIQPQTFPSLNDQEFTTSAAFKAQVNLLESIAAKVSPTKPLAKEALGADRTGEAGTGGGRLFPLKRRYSRRQSL